MVVGFGLSPKIRPNVTETMTAKRMDNISQFCRLPGTRSGFPKPALFAIRPASMSAIQKTGLIEVILANGILILL